MGRKSCPEHHAYLTLHCYQTSQTFVFNQDVLGAFAFACRVSCLMLGILLRVLPKQDKKWNRHHGCFLLLIPTSLTSTMGWLRTPSLARWKPCLGRHSFISSSQIIRVRLLPAIPFSFANRSHRVSTCEINTMDL